MAAADHRHSPVSPPGRNWSLSPRARYVAFTHALIAMAALLMVLGQWLVLTFLLLSCMVFAPRIVAIVTQSRGDDILFRPYETPKKRPDRP